MKTEADRIPDQVTVGQSIIIASRHGPAYAGLVEKGKITTWLPKEQKVSGMSGQMVSYTFTFDAPGTYLVGGNEWGKFSKKVKVVRRETP